MSAPLSFQELHSQQDVADGVQPRVSVWLHSLLTSSK